jgi:hypothetical protein
MAKVNKLRMLVLANSVVGLSACAVLLFGDRNGPSHRIAWGVLLIVWPLTWVVRFAKAGRQKGP